MDKVISFILVSSTFAIILFIANGFIIKYKYKSKGIVSSLSYECGSSANEYPYYRHKFKFFLIAIIFLLFEVEVIFLLPFVAIFKGLSLMSLNSNFQTFIFIEIFIFIAIIGLGLIYAVKRKFLALLKY